MFAGRVVSQPGGPRGRRAASNEKNQTAGGRGPPEVGVGQSVADHRVGVGPARDEKGNIMQRSSERAGTYVATSAAGTVLRQSCRIVCPAGHCTVCGRGNVTRTSEIVVP